MNITKLQLLRQIYFFDLVSFDNFVPQNYIILNCLLSMQKQKPFLLTFLVVVEIFSRFRLFDHMLFQYTSTAPMVFERFIRIDS